MGGENRETRLGRSRAGLLQSARDFHLVFVTFGALQSLRNSDPLFALLGTAIETHVASRSLLAEYGHAFQLRHWRVILQSYSYKACMLRVMPNFASGLHEEVLMLPQMHALMYAACQCRQDM